MVFYVKLKRDLELHLKVFSHLVCSIGQSQDLVVLEILHVYETFLMKLKKRFEST